jgi:hypothetical protein
VFIRVYRLEIQSVMLVLSTLCTVAPLTFALVQLSPTPFPVRISLLYTGIQCVMARGGEVSGSQTDKHLPQNPYTSQFFR